jgi:protein-S-isoprenylcysteine O-methyltransferase Ste14
MNRQRGARGAARLIELAALLALPVMAHYVLPITTLLSAPYRYLGIPVMVAGLLVATAAAQAFLAVGASFQLHREAPHLVMDGPFGMSRNPMYLGMLMWLVGLAMLLGSLTPFAFPVLLFLFLNFLIVPMEERSLRQLHPQEYAEYQRRVRRWL